jgi:L-ascorbate metabolism protein UlaG (beta-lactamase superfamily)
MVRIRWWGHACFEVGNGITLVFDPHDGESVGLPRPDVKADVVLVSHDHYDHAAGVKLVLRPGGTVVRNAVEKNIGGARIRGVETFHDDQGGGLRGKNTVYVVNFGGLTICHLGDLGHVPTSEQVRGIGKVDVLFIPVGGVYTIDAGEAAETVQKIVPRITVPMHYRIKGLKVGIAGVEDFLSGKRNVIRIKSREFRVSPEALPKSPEIWVLSFP